MLRSLAICLPLIAACAATELPSSTSDVDSRSTVADWSDFTIGPNDLIFVSVLGRPEYSSPPKGVRVSPQGTLSFPLLGAVSVAGKSADEVAEVLEAGLTEYEREPSVSVAVMEYSSRRFYLFGEVKTAGPVPMDRPITALEALAMGGGWLPGARREQVVIVRTHGTADDDIEVIPFNAETPGPDGLVQVRPGDFLFVGKAGVGVFSESILPYMQGIGLTAGQLSNVLLVTNELSK